MAMYSPPSSKNVTINGVLITIKWCNTCNFYRPPRVIHCGICDNCVNRFDHHCPYVGNCVGQRNYRYFLIFIFGTLFCSAYGCAHSIALLAIQSMKYGFYDAYQINPTAWVFAFIVAFVGFITVLLVGVLVFFTSYLICRGRTTNENIKGMFPVKNPYDKGVIRNWWNALFPPQYPTSVDPRERLVVDV
eukprot:TRINITY_DN3195_c0_g1_i2.p1 TRINITY_DN3195_c0_g1~~TRINITY_DN3195_c0_g1_i2.p1  ORF type:complete len:189 (+),score=22.68 TRINITY_DN3195_c0_g1_i2:445-1011(+)